MITEIHFKIDIFNFIVLVTQCVQRASRLL